MGHADAAPASTGLDAQSYADIVERASDAVVVCDDGGKVLWANETVTRILGWEREDLIGRPVEVLVPTVAKERHRAHRKAFTNAPVSRPMGAALTLVAVRADGSELPVEISLTPIERPEGRLVAAAIRDVSARRAAEVALRESQQQLRTSLDSMLDGYAVLSSVRDADGQVVDLTWSYVNEQGARSFGLPVTALLDHPISEIAPKVVQSPTFAQLVEVVERRLTWAPTPFRDEEAGFQGIVELRAWPLGDGLALTWRDVSGAVETAERLREGEERFRGVTANLPDALTIFRPVRDEVGRLTDLRFDYANRAASISTGYSVDDLVGRSLTEVFPGVTTTGLLERYRKVLDTGEAFVDPCYWYDEVWGDGQRRRRAFDLRASRIGDSLMVVSRDITADREREQELARRQAELQRSNDEMRLLNELADLLQGCQSPDEAYQVTSGIAARLFPGLSGACSAVRESRDLVEVQIAWGGLGPGLVSFPPTECWALRRGQAHASVRGAPRCPHLGPDAPDAPRALCVPMAAQGQTSGAFHLLVPPGVADPDPQLVQLALTMSAQLSLAVANLDLRETLRGLSIRDSLTGLFNRRYMEETLARELSRAQRHGTSLVVLQLDVDHFKRINDEYGHDAGDAVLGAVAQSLRLLVRDGDVVCRFGGEEFTAILPETDAETALLRMRDLRARLSGVKVPYRGAFIDAPTISGGLALYPYDGTTGDDLVRAADQALYAAKAAGRDRVITAESMRDGSHHPASGWAASGVPAARQP